MFLDIDECLRNISECDYQATCTDTDGSFACSCNTGFSGSGLLCNGMYQFLWLYMNSNRDCISKYFVSWLGEY